MPSDPPPPEPSPAGSDLAGRRRQTSAVRDGTLVFALVLGGFVAYAVGGPTKYRATAVVAVEPIPGASAPALPKPAEASERLRRAALDSTLVARLASEERTADSPQQATARVASSLSVDSRDGRSFTLATTGPTPERSQRVINELAEQAAKRAAQVLDPDPPDVVDPAARAKTELLDFLAAHPGIASETPAPAPTRSGPDPLVLALRGERARIEAKLSEPAAARSTDNPYEELPLPENPDVLRRRLREIDTTLEARTKPPAAASASAAPPAASTGRPPTGQERAEWQRLVRALSETKSPENAVRGPRLRVTLARAALPKAPIEPNRPKLVLVGVLTAAFAGLLAGILRHAFEARALRRYGIKTGAHPIAGLPNTTLRISREQLPKPIAPKTDPLPTPVPTAPPNPGPMTPIPPAPLVPAPITPIPPAPIAPSPITTLHRAPAGTAPSTPVPPAPVPGASPAAPGAVPDTPIPPEGVAPPPVGSLEPVKPVVIPGPTGAPDHDAPPTTQAYGEEKPVRKNRRITQIYGTPPPPDLDEEAKALRRTQGYGTPPIPVPPNPALPNSPTPIPAEVLPPPHRTSLRPAPMIPLSRSSAPPIVTPSTRSSAPLAETGYSYVQTPVPEAHAIPQTPYPRAPSPPPRTHPFGSAPPAANRPQSDPPAQDPNRQKTSAPPSSRAHVTTHSVPGNWKPDRTLDVKGRRPLCDQLLPFTVEGCFVLGVTSVPESSGHKSRLAAELALALAERKHPRVLLLEADFQGPNVDRVMQVQMPMSGGFSQQLRARVQNQAERRWSVVECTPCLHVLAEGVMRSPGLLLSNQFDDALKSLRTYYDLIVIDGPTTASEGDCRAFDAVLDGIVMATPKNGSPWLARALKLFSDKRFSIVIGVGA